jgi:ferric-dicitrate binding protein FerR (iron transport regulator)
MEINRNRLDTYFLGQSSESEKDFIRRWLESDEAHKRQFINERIRFDASLVADDNEWALPAAPSRTRQFILTTLKIASAIILLVGSNYLFNLYQHKQPDIVIQSVHVPPGNRTSLTLPDGTLVWLNSNTTLTYPNVFPDNERVVELNGEAYFEVAKYNHKPFIAKTHKYNVEVLGTTFNLEAYNNKPDFITTLFTGKIKLYKEQLKNEALLLNAGETATLSGDALCVSRTDTESYKWRDGLIIIEDKSFEEVMYLFEKYFNHQIIIKNEKVKQLGYQGKLRIADGVDHGLRVLQKDFRFTYKRDEDTKIITIY